MKISRRFLGVLLVSLGSILVGFGVWVLVPKTDSVVDSFDTVTRSVSQPDETLPGLSYEWKGASTEPKFISIPAVGISGYIQKVGVDQNKEVAVPNNIHFAGWFN